MFAEIPEDGWTANPDPDRKWAFAARVSHPDWVWGPVKIADFGSPAGRNMEGVTYSDDFRSISVPKPVRGEIVSIELVPKASRTPDTGEYGWDKLVIKSMVSEDPWYFEVKDNLTGETLGIVGADAPLTLRKPTTAMVTKWGTSTGLPIEIALARDYPNFRFAETGAETVRVAWDWGNETRQVATVVAGGAEPSPSPISPGFPTVPTPENTSTICVSGVPSFPYGGANGTYQAGVAWNGRQAWVNSSSSTYAVFPLEGGGYEIGRLGAYGSVEDFASSSSLTGGWSGGIVVNIGQCGPSSSPSPGTSPIVLPPLPPPPSPSPQASPSPQGFGNVVIRHITDNNPNPLPTPNASNFFVVHGQNIGDNRRMENTPGGYGFVQAVPMSSWTAGDDPGWPLIIRVDIADTAWDPAQQANVPTYGVWKQGIPGAVYSSDQRTISVPKPPAGQTLYLDLTSSDIFTPTMDSGEWPTLTIKSKISTDPWYFEVSGANLPGNDQYRVEGILGIVSADSPLVLVAPPQWLISAVKGGNQVWSGSRNWTYEGGMSGDTGGQESFDMKLYLTRDYPDIVFQENQDTIYTYRWEKLRSTGTTLHLVGLGASPSPSPSPTPTPTPEPTPEPTPVSPWLEPLSVNTYPEYPGLRFVADGSGQKVSVFAESTVGGAVTVPSHILSPSGNSIPVTGVGEGGFAGSAVTSVSLPATVTTIGATAFLGCVNLVSIDIPDTVTDIGWRAFEGCAALTSVTLPSGLTSIGGYAFFGSSALTSITIPDSVKSIGGHAFRGSGLTSVVIPSGVTSILASTFYGCNFLTSVTIPDTVTSIEGYAFFGCSSLTSVSIPSSVTSIDGSTFQRCSSLTSVTIPQGVTSIGWMAFAYCSGLNSITIPNSVTSIGDSAFIDSTSLTSLIIPDSVTSIARRGLAGLPGLTSISIPNSVTSLGDGLFWRSPNLTSITLPDRFRGQEARLNIPAGAVVTYIP
jgi:hypothetical protein